MRLTKRKLRDLILEEFDLLLEAEPEEEESEEEEPEEDDIYVSPEEQAMLSRSADDQILAYLIDFETKAMKSAAVAADNTLRVAPDVEIEVEGWYKHPLSDMLFEEEGVGSKAAAANWVGSHNIDIASYAADVSRLIDNYDSLLDMEALIINKAMDYLLDKYDQETTTYFEEMMDVTYDKYVGTTQRAADEEDAPPAPQALGSMDTGGGA